MVAGMSEAPAEKPCRWCGGEHRLCPYVKAVEFDDVTGLIITRVEFLVPADFGVAREEKPQPTDPAAGPASYPRLKPSGE
jgi:hypothetical protein